MLRKTIASISAGLLGLILSLFFVTVVITLTVRPGDIKSWVAGSGLYNSAVDNVLKDAEKKVSEEGGQADLGGLSITDPAVQQAAKEALTPSFLQSSTEQVVDGSFEWLDGKSNKPNFAINVAPVKQRFADSLAAYAKQRYQNLPDCAPRTLPKSTDPLTIDCKPPVSFDINAQVEQFRNKILQSNDVLAKPVISPDSLTTDGKTSQQPFAERYRAVPQSYQAARVLPWALIIPAFALAAATIFLSIPKKKGLQRVGWTILGMGIAVSVITILTSTGFAKAKDKVASDPAFASSFKDSLLKLLDALQQDLVRHATIVCAVYLLLGGGIVLGLLLYNRRLKPTPPPGAGKIISN